MTAAAGAADALVERVRARPWGLAVVAIDGDDTVVRLDSGVDELTAESVFQIGSITKTFTGLLLATAVVRGEAALDQSVGDVLGDRAGRAGAVTLGALATQRSGLPRLPPNLAVTDRRDPYADYSEDDLLAALSTVELASPPPFEYSNFGFMLLGLLLGEITGVAYAELVAARVLEPLGLRSAGCPPPEAGRVPGYSGASSVPWWRTSLPGAGGIGMSIADLGAYLRACIERSTGDGALDDALELATSMHAEPPNGMGLGWAHQGGGWWHNGATGGFTSFAAFHGPTRTAVGLLANGAGVSGLDAAGFEVITAMVRR